MSSHRGTGGSPGEGGDVRPGSATFRRGRGVGGGAAAAGPFAPPAASAATGPTTSAPVDAAPIATIIEPATAGTVANSATQFGDTIPLGRAAPAPSLSPLPVAGPLASGLPVVGPVSGIAMPLLSGVS